MGGNKTRHLEYIMAQALENEADTVVFGAAAQSNYARQLSAACAQLGLKAHLILTRYYGQRLDQGNVILDRFFGATIEWADVPLNALNPLKQEAGDRLRQAGRRPYVVLPPSSEELGAISYLRAALEIDAQFEVSELDPTAIYLAAAGPTQAGLVAGKIALGWALTVRGVAPTTREFSITEDVHQVATAILSKLDWTLTIDSSDIRNVQDYVGPSYGHPTSESIAALELVGRQEGIILDPIYTGKAMAALIHDTRSGAVKGPVVFWHTGGTPALFAFSEELSNAGI